MVSRGDQCHLPESLGSGSSEPSPVETLEIARGMGHGCHVAISEAARNHLYTGLAELLGPERTETLMSAIPRHDLDEVATKSDILLLKSDIALLGAELREEFRSEFRSELTSKVGSLRAELSGQIAALGASLNSRIDRVFYANIATMLGVLGAMTTLIVKL
jgi:hypothetical protein